MKGERYIRIENIISYMDYSLLQQYSEMVAEEINSEQFTKSLLWLIKIKTSTNSLNEAVSLFGEKQVSQKIEEAIREELLLFDERGNDDFSLK